MHGMLEVMAFSTPAVRSPDSGAARADVVGGVAPATAPLRLGPLTVDPPVVLAPMAGVTDAPFRVLCASFGGGLFVNQMVTARALLEGHAASWELARFHPSERVRSLQLYGTDPLTLGEAVRRLVAEDRVDHIDMNFGCPAAKVTRNGGGAALPYKRRLLRQVIRAAVRAANAESAGRVPITVKFRLGIDDDHLTYLETARIAEDEGVAWVALHARTALQHYAPQAHWDRIAELKAQVRTIPVLGNGDVFSGSDALDMMQRTGCDGVVVGRGCLGRPWLFRDLAAAFAGDAPPPAPRLGEVADTIRRHVELIVDWQGGEERLAHFRKHLAWYLKGYPVGAAVRQQAGQVSTVAEISHLLEQLDPAAEPVEDVERIVRSHSNALKRVALPDGWLDDPDEDVQLPRGAEALVSGG
ncbi:MAG: tRNA dihydrouridine synthase DusB [Microthrixaceae bacterium]